MQASQLYRSISHHLWHWLLIRIDWILWLLVLQTMLFYRHEISFQLVQGVKAASQWLANQQLQQKVAVDFVVKRPQQSKNIQFISLLKRDTVVLLMSPNCHACDVALVQLAQFEQQFAALEVDLLVLSSAEFPASLPHLQLPFYQISTGFQPELFETLFKPTLLKFDDQGKLLAKTAGWSLADINRLTGMASPAVLD